MLEENSYLLNDNQAIFKHFFDISPDLLCITGFDGYFKKINPSISKLLGYSEEELLSRPIKDFIHKDDRNHTELMRAELTRNTPLQNFENRYVTKSGEIIWLAWTAMPVMADKVVYAIAKNVTHKKVLDEERNLLLFNFTKLNDDLKKLSYTSSHNLRSPVNNLLSIFSMLDVSKISDSETLQFIEMLKQTSENLKDALNEYLDILIQRDNVNTKTEIVDLNDALSIVLLSVNSLIENSKANIIADFSNLQNVTFNKAYMESVFLNLITNSIKYAQPGVPPVIKISSTIYENRNQLIFADNGLGFNMEVVKNKIFGLNQKFHHHTDSKGIGLYLVHNHVKSLGGEITVESEINQGTQFVISFKS